FKVPSESLQRRLQESRMRENRTYGLTRGQRRVLTLFSLYSTAFSVHLCVTNIFRSLKECSKLNGGSGNVNLNMPTTFNR
ncbi:MAG: hypothetical protein ABIN89_25390, partial [Chitinophagaceae bacterium]